MATGGSNLVTPLRTGQTQLDRVQDRFLGPVNALLANSLTWVTVGTSGAPQFANGWVNYSGNTPPFNTSNYYPLQFTKTTLGLVLLRGVIKSGTVNAVIFTLPAGFRPGLTINFPCVSNNVFGLITVSYNGTVTILGSNVYTDFGTISFVAEQ